VILTIIGTRPQYIKSSIVSKKIKKLSGGLLEEVIIDTGQHYDSNMSAAFVKELSINNIKYNLNINKSSHADMTARMISAIDKILLIERPTCVLVYGDTNSTLSAALSAVKRLIPIYHVEAGVRSFDMSVPEEINRVITDRISSVMFAPTLTACNNLRAEGIEQKKIIFSGDVMYDLVLDQVEHIDSTRSKYNFKNYIIVTLHRQENTDSSSKLRIFLELLCLVSKHYSVVWPIHPRIRQLVQEKYSYIYSFPNINIIEPLSYSELIAAIYYAKAVITDSGGLQKEAFFLKRNCFTLRDITSWPETVVAGWNNLVGLTDEPENLCKQILDGLGFKGDDSQPFGKGNSSEIIASALLDFN